MKRPVQSHWIAALEIAATAIYQQDGGLMSNDTGWRDDELLDAWLRIRKEIQRLENADTRADRGRANSDDKH